MNHWACVLLAAGVAAALPVAASAQTGPRASPGLQQPTLRDDEQILPSQIVPPPPAAKPKKPAVKKPQPAAANPDTDDEPPVAPAKPKPKTAVKPAVVNPEPGEEPPVKPAASSKPAESARAVSCANGIFAKNSGHLRLAQSYGVHNVEYTEVSGDDGSTLMASVIFPNDPKRRLEVLWDDDIERTGTRMIVIGGQSTWTAQKGIHLGLPLAALEKLNGKPFKLMGFEKGGMAIVSDWNNGALGLLTDGCKVGVQLRPDPKAPEATLSAAGSDKEFASSDAAIRAAKPTIGEIIVGY